MPPSRIGGPNWSAGLIGRTESGDRDGHLALTRCGAIADKGPAILELIATRLTRAQHQERVSVGDHIFVGDFEDIAQVDRECGRRSIGGSTPGIKDCPRPSFDDEGVHLGLTATDGKKSQQCRHRQYEDPEQDQRRPARGTLRRGQFM